MTNLNSVNIGHNKYCGPAVLSILTGKSTDACARVISSINGKYNITGVKLDDLIRAANKLGFNEIPYRRGNSLYGTLVMHSNDDGMYIVSLPNHFVCIEVKDKSIYFCDNHTKEPMPAASSARLLQKVQAIYKVIKRPEVIIPPKPVLPKPPEPVQVSSKIVAERELTSDSIEFRINQQVTYDIPQYNRTLLITRLKFANQQDLDEFINSFKEYL